MLGLGNEIYFIRQFRKKSVCGNFKYFWCNGVVKNTSPSFVLADDNETEPEHTSDFVSVVGFLPDFSAFLMPLYYLKIW
jgi:hypothetical protein